MIYVIINVKTKMIKYAIKGRENIIAFTKAIIK